MGRKRKKSKSSPQNNNKDKRLAMAHNVPPIAQSQQILQQNGQYQSNINGYNGYSGLQQASPNFVNQNQQTGQPMFQYSPVNLGSQTGTQYIPQPQTPTSSGTSVSSDQFSLLIQRLDRIELKLAQLDSIQSTVNGINIRLNCLDQKVNGLETKMSDIEISRNHDASCISDISKKQKELDSLMSKFKKLENEQCKREQDMKAEIIDLKGRSMRDNLLFFGIEEEKGEKDSDCVQKVLIFIEEKLGHENATTDVKLHRAHRIGKYKPTGTRPIVAKFAYFPDREKVRLDARKLSRPFGISQQFPVEVMERRRKLVPVMLDARKAGKEAYLAADKLYIDGHLYRDGATSGSG